MAGGFYGLRDRFCADSLPLFTFPENSGTGGTSFLGKWGRLLLSVRIGRLGSGRFMPALAVKITSFQPYNENH